MIGGCNSRNSVKCEHWADMASSARVIGKIFFVEERHGSAFQRSLFSGAEVRRSVRLEECMIERVHD